MEYLTAGERRRISVVGLGKLGLPMAAVLSAAGHHVVGVDRNRDLINELRAGTVTLDEPHVADLFAAAPFQATVDTAAAVADTEATVIIVPTPSDPLTDRFDDQFVLEAVADATETMNDGHLLVVASTVMPGTAHRRIIPLLVSKGFTPGNNIDFCYSPEFIALGSVVDDMTCPDMVLIGESTRRAGARYEKILQPTWRPVAPQRTHDGGSIDPHSTIPHPPVHRMPLLDAEIAKIALNTYVTMKISFANQLGELCARAGGNSALVTNAIGDDRRVGRAYLRPGAAYGGPCFPRDTEAFQAWARELGKQAELAKATNNINREVKHYIARMVSLCPGTPRTVAVLGTAYKPGTPVDERSPGLDVAEHLHRQGFKVTVHDPAAPRRDLPGVGWADTPEDAVSGADVAVVATAHPVYATVDYPGHVIDCWWHVAADRVAGELFRVGVGRNPEAWDQ